MHNFVFLHVFSNRFNYFFTTMDYTCRPWSKRKNLAHFITKTKNATSTKIYVPTLDINPYLHKFIEPILINSSFLTLDVHVYIVHGPKGRMANCLSKM